MRSVVVFPHPDGPTRTRNSPSSTPRFRSITAASEPKSLCTPSNRTSAIAVSPYGNGESASAGGFAVRGRLDDGHRVMLDLLLVEEKAEAGSVGHADVPLGVDPEGLGQHPVARVRGPAARRIVRELEMRAVGDGRREMEVREQPHTVAPGVRNHETAFGLR